MILVKVVSGEVVKFPYSLEDLRMEHPSVSFPAEPNENILNSYSAYTVKYYSYPEYDARTQKLIISSAPVLISGEWAIKHEVINKTAEEIVAYDEGELKVLRQKILNNIDTQTNYLIAYGWVYQGSHVRLSIEDQINFEGEFNLIKDLVSAGMPEAGFFPVNYKVWTNDDGSPVFLVLSDITELRMFLSSGKKYIRDCLSEGWLIKNTAISATIDELKTWKDKRLSE